MTFLPVIKSAEAWSACPQVRQVSDQVFLVLQRCLGVNDFQIWSVNDEITDIKCVDMLKILNYIYRLMELIGRDCRLRVSQTWHLKHHYNSKSRKIGSNKEKGLSIFQKTYMYIFKTFKHQNSQYTINTLFLPKV